MTFTTTLLLLSGAAGALALTLGENFDEAAAKPCWSGTDTIVLASGNWTFTPQAKKVDALDCGYCDAGSVGCIRARSYFDVDGCSHMDFDLNGLSRIDWKAKYYNHEIDPAFTLSQSFDAGVTYSLVNTYTAGISFTNYYSALDATQGPSRVKFCVQSEAEVIIDTVVLTHTV